MFVSKECLRKAAALLAGTAVLSLSMQGSALAQDDDDDGLGIPRVCFAKPWLPICEPGGPDPVPPQDPFPCDLMEPGCPWWIFR
jgi:hypothetical protein